MPRRHLGRPDQVRAPVERLPPEHTAKRAVVLRADRLHNIIHGPTVEVFVREHVERNAVRLLVALDRVERVVSVARDALVDRQQTQVEAVVIPLVQQCDDVGEDRRIFPARSRQGHALPSREQLVGADCVVDLGFKGQVEALAAEGLVGARAAEEGARRAAWRLAEVFSLPAARGCCLGRFHRFRRFRRRHPRVGRPAWLHPPRALCVLVCWCVTYGIPRAPSRPVSRGVKRGGCSNFLFFSGALGDVESFRADRVVGRQARIFGVFSELICRSGQRECNSLAHTSRLCPSTQPTWVFPTASDERTGAAAPSVGAVRVER